MVIDFIYSMHPFVLRALINIFIIIMLLGGTLLVLRFCPASEDDSDNVIGLSATVAFIWAIFIGFVIFASVNNLAKASDSAATEARLVSTINYEASFLSKPLALQTNLLLKKYLNNVINQEWPAMTIGKVDTSALAPLFQLKELLLNNKPAADDAVGVNLWTDLIQRTNDLYQEHETRIDFSQNLSLSTGVWYCLIIATFIMLLSNLFYYFKALSTQLILLCCIGVVTGLLVFLEISINFPYRGYYGVTSAGFVEVLQQLNSW